MRPCEHAPSGLLVISLCAAIFGLSTPASATQVTWQTGPCPVGKDTVRIFTKVSENRVGGWDADGASYAKEGQWRTHRVSTCAETLFSLYGEDIPGLQLDDATRARLLQALEAAKRELADADNPQVWERYRIAARLYAELGRSTLFMADLWLEASWTVRDHGVGYYEGLTGPAVTRKLLDAGQTELAKGLPPSQEKSVRFNLARVAHRGGYSAERDAHLKAFEALGPVSPREAEAIARLRQAAELEPFYQREALRWFLQASEDRKLTPPERARASYLVGELSRRLGDLDTARASFAAALQDDALDADLREMATTLAAELSAG